MVSQLDFQQVVGTISFRTLMECLSVWPVTEDKPMPRLHNADVLISTLDNLVPIIGHALTPDDLPVHQLVLHSPESAVSTSTAFTLARITEALAVCGAVTTHDGNVTSTLSQAKLPVTISDRILQQLVSDGVLSMRHDDVQGNQLALRRDTFRWVRKRQADASVPAIIGISESLVRLSQTGQLQMPSDAGLLLSMDQVCVCVCVCAAQ